MLIIDLNNLDIQRTKKKNRTFFVCFNKDKLEQMINSTNVVSIFDC